MSEYTPITGELRKYATVAWDPWPEARDRLYQMCDAIDAIHAQLERENESLKAELNRVLGEQEEHAHTRGESITDELRGYARGYKIYVNHKLLEIADRIDAEHERQLEVLYRDMSDAEWVRLPKDADGVPIHIGDVMVYADGNTCPLPVVALVPPAVFLTDEGPRYADMCRHAPDTWERIIEDAIGEGMARQRNNDSSNFCEWANPMNNGALVARCKALCERTKEDE